MKLLLIILKTLIIGCLWSIVFIDGIRVVLLINWHFDIFMKEHWALLSKNWNSGASMSRSEIAFFLIIVSSIPLWLVGWIGLITIKWGRLFKKIFMWPIYLFRKATLKTKPPVVIKKRNISEETTTTKKVTEVKKAPVKRPPLPSATLLKSNINNNLSASSQVTTSYPTATKKNPETPVNHALFNFDDDDFDLDFDFDKKSKEKEEEKIPSALMVDKQENEKEEKFDKKITETATHSKNPDTGNNTKQKENNQTKQKTATTNNVAKDSHTPVLDVLTQKGYDIIQSAIIKNTTIDYIAVSKNQLILCMIDKETGDWLADEEKFNDEEPLWFSESSHRISPVRKVDLARDIIKTKLAVADMNFEIISYVIIQSGFIINAEDMVEIWNNMNINVTRINRGGPKDLHLFSKSLENCEEKTDKSTLEKLKKLVRSMAQ